MSLFARTVTEAATATPKASSKPKDKAKGLIVDAIKQAVEGLAGKPVSMIYPNFNLKGFDASFKAGGRFKLRSKPDGSVHAKLKGLPKHGDYWLGVGKSIPEALANMKMGVAEDPVSPSAKPPGPKPKSKPEPEKVEATKPTREVIDGQALHNDAGLDQKTFDRYAAALSLSTELLRRRGFGFMIGNFTMHIRPQISGVAGVYTGAAENEVNPTIEIVSGAFPGHNVNDIAVTMVHEMGHHYYYKEIPRAKRKEYERLFEKAWGDVGSPKRYWVVTFEKDGEQRKVRLKGLSKFKKPGGGHYNEPSTPQKAETIAREINSVGSDWTFKEATPPSASTAVGALRQKAHKEGRFSTTYGASDRYEDFAEIFAAFVGRGSKLGSPAKDYQLTPDVMARFKAFMADDKRISLKAESLSLFGRIIESQEDQ